MQPISSNTSLPAVPASPYPQDVGKQSASTNTHSTEWTTNTAAKLTTTSTTSSTITTSHTSVTATASTTTTTSKPVLFIPTNRSEFATALLHQQKTGVPPLHQALIDKDHAMAEALIAGGADLSACICPVLDQTGVSVDDRTLRKLVYNPQWTSVISKQKKLNIVDRTTPKLNDNPKSTSIGSEHLDSSNKTKSSERSHLATDLPDVKEYKYKPVVDLALLLKACSPQGRLSYNGCNAITLGLLSGAPWTIMKKLFREASQRWPSLLSARDQGGRTPLTIAVDQGRIKMIKLLLNYDADATLTDAQNRNPLEHAFMHGHTEIIHLLIEYGLCAPVDGEIDVIRNGIDKKSNEYKAKFAVDQMFSQLDINALLTYQKQSRAHWNAVSAALLHHTENAVFSGEPAQLEQLLHFAEPLLEPNRLSMMAQGIACHAGTLPALMRVLACFGEAGFPREDLVDLRESACNSRDAELLEFVTALDPQLEKILAGEVKPTADDQPLLKRMLAVAIWCHSNTLIDSLKRLGVTINRDDPEVGDLWSSEILFGADE